MVIFGTFGYFMVLFGITGYYKILPRGCSFEEYLVELVVCHTHSDLGFDSTVRNSDEECKNFNNY